MVHVVHADDADITFASSDHILLRVHSVNLSCNSEGFAPPIGTSAPSTQEVVQLTETCRVLELLFQFMYPQRSPDLSVIEFDLFLEVAEEAEKYQVFSAMQICAMEMEYVPLNLLPFCSDVISYTSSLLGSEQLIRSIHLK